MCLKCEIIVSVVILSVVGNFAYHVNYFESTDISDNIINFIENIHYSSSNVGLCLSQFSSIADGIAKGESWALQFFDAWGKLPSGIIWGNTVNYGNYDECLHIAQQVKDGKEMIHGQYCLANIPLWSLSPTVSAPGYLTIGVCVPDSCDVDDLQKLFTSRSDPSVNRTGNEEIFKKELCTRHESPIFNALDIAAIVIFSLIGLIMLASTVYEFCMEQLNRDKNKIWITFSVITNGRKLFKVEKKKSPDIIECLYGIRCLSIIWIISANAYSMRLFQPLFFVHATVVVDTFFLLSGFLVSWRVFKELNRWGSLNIPVMYFHRYWRLFPILAATILFSMSLFQYIGEGPLWKVELQALVPCRQYWWTALLHVQNYVNLENMCIGHSWYLSVDTQLYFLSPLILLPLWKWGIKFIWVIPLMIIASMAAVYVEFLEDNHKIDGASSGYEYYGTHQRAGPWLVGVLLAYGLFAIRGHRLQVSKYVKLGGWIASILVFSAVLFGFQRAEQRDGSPSVIERALYVAMSRVAWSVAVTWLIFACTQGFGGVVNTFLSLGVWQPISRLSYALYLNHILVYIYANGVIKTNSYFSDFDNVQFFWGNFGVVFTVSFGLVLAIESPFIALEDLFYYRKKDAEISLAV